MASTKALFLFALLASAVLLATAAEQTHGEEEKVKTNDASVQDWRGGGGYPGRGGGGYPGGGGYGSPRYCRWGCCRRGYRGGCDRCCGAADEVAEPTELPGGRPHA